MEPYAGLVWDKTHTEGFTEKGGPARLRSKSRTQDNYSTSIGSRVHVPATERLALNADLGWMHTFGGLSPKSVMRFAEGGEQFSIEGASISRDALHVGLSADIRISDSVSLNIGYTGMFGERDTTHGGSAMFKLEW